MKKDVNIDELKEDLKKALAMLNMALDDYYDVTGDQLEDLEEGYQELKEKYKIGDLEEINIIENNLEELSD